MAKGGIIVDKNAERAITIDTFSASNNHCRLENSPLFLERASAVLGISTSAIKKKDHLSESRLLRQAIGHVMRHKLGYIDGKIALALGLDKKTIRRNLVESSVRISTDPSFALLVKRLESVA